MTQLARELMAQSRTGMTKAPKRTAAAVEDE